MSEEELETLRYVDCSSSEIEIVNKAVDTIKKIQQENKQLKELCDKYEKEHLTTFQIWLTSICEYETKVFKKNDTLNKGIDELIKKYENILHHLEKSQTQRFNHTYQIKIDLIKEYKEELKKLKGSE